MTHRYLMTLTCPKAFANRPFVEVVEVEGPKPLEAMAEAIRRWQEQHTDLWLRDEVVVRLERVAPGGGA